MGKPMLRILRLFFLSLIISLPQNLALAFGPQLQVDCGKWIYKKDGKVSVRELSTLALFTHSGDSFKVRADFFSSAKSKTSLGTLKWTHTIIDPEYESRTTEFPLKMQFNSRFNSEMYKTKYIKGNFKFTDNQGFESLQTCIWKW
jgi:hypothetical protein